MPRVLKRIDVVVNPNEVNKLVSSEIERYLMDNCGLTWEEVKLCDGPLFFEVMKKDDLLGVQFILEAEVPLSIYEKLSSGKPEAPMGDYIPEDE